MQVRLISFFVETGTDCTAMTAERLQGLFRYEGT